MISVVIPTYNEEKNIRELLDEIGSELEDGFEVIVVDDSDDSTAEEARRSELDRLKVVEREESSGIGSAIQRGLKEAGGDIVVQMDADFSHQPEEIMALVEKVREGADVAVGSRYVEGGERNDPLLRRINPLIGSYLYKYVVGCPVKDFTSGFKAYKREVADELAHGEFPEGFEFQAASLMCLVRKDKQVEEVAITFSSRKSGEPKYCTEDLVGNILLFIRLALERWEKPLKFGIVGASGVFVNMGLLYFLTEVFGLYYLFSAALAVEASIVSNFALNEFWTFIERGEEGFREILGRFLKFNTVSAAGMAINLVLLAFLTEVLGIYYILSNMLAITAVFVWNYLLNVAWTWPE